MATAGVSLLARQDYAAPVRLGGADVACARAFQADCGGPDPVVDAIVHLGDHCYDLSMGNDLHGDTYMNAFEPVISQSPWLPVIGHHESNKGAGGG